MRHLHAARPLHFAIAVKRFAFGVLGIITGCAHHPPTLDPHCTLAEPVARELVPAPIELLHEHTIGSVALTGADPALTATLRHVVMTRPGDSLDGTTVADDIRRLWALGVLSDVRVDIASSGRGADLTFAVTPQPIIGRVYISGASPDALELRRLRMLEGTPYEPLRVARMAAATQTALVYDGYLDAKIEVQRAHDGSGLCVMANRGSHVVIDKLAFPGATSVSQHALAARVRGESAGINHVGGIYDESLLSDDKLYLMEAFHEIGRFGTHIDHAKTVRHGDRISVEVPIHEGPIFHLGDVRVIEPGGTTIPLGLQRGDVFVRSRVAAASERIREHAFADADVYPRTTIDKDTTTVSIAFLVNWRWPWQVLQLLRSR